MSFTAHISDIQVKINSVLLYADESILALSIGNGYVIEKSRIEVLPIYERITDRKGQLDINYLGSKLTEPDVFDPEAFRPIVSLVHLHKEDTFTVNPPIMENGIHYSDSQLDCHEQLDTYQDKEFQYLNSIASLLQIFKKGNIGLKEIFFEFRYTVINFANQTKNSCINIQDANIVKQMKYALLPNEVVACNSFIAKHMGIRPDGTRRFNSDGSGYISPEFRMMNPIINEFTFGLKQIDIPTGFEQFTTALEMTFLTTNEQGKKEALSRRTAALLGNTDTDVSALFDKMKNFYRFRSESLHEGDGSNITDVELKELEDIVRQVIQKYLIFCEAEIIANPSTTWDIVKAKKIHDLKNIVIGYKTRGVLPQ
ncbi:MAG: hypothetical protein APF81_25740 [Desulfosporosinus sp. BRH_c37]|nr:MAG: hypothetical protein APF81_25740 [Desulfosporosinus sp. BRH_c37]